MCSAYSDFSMVHSQQIKLVQQTNCCAWSRQRPIFSFGLVQVVGGGKVKLTKHTRKPWTSNNKLVMMGSIPHNIRSIVWLLTLFSIRHCLAYDVFSNRLLHSYSWLNVTGHNLIMTYVITSTTTYTMMGLIELDNATKTVCRVLMVRVIWILHLS